jgi:hypothetical protein
MTLSLMVCPLTMTADVLRALLCFVYAGVQRVTESLIDNINLMSSGGSRVRAILWFSRCSYLLCAGPALPIPMEVEGDAGGMPMVNPFDESELQCGQKVNTLSSLLTLSSKMA